MRFLVKVILVLLVIGLSGVFGWPYVQAYWKARNKPNFRLAAVTKDLHGSVRDVFAEIDATRRAHAKPASDFSLKDYDGKDVHLADFKGHVVLLNFWHPT